METNDTGLGPFCKLLALPGHGADDTPEPRLVTRPSYTLKKSPGYSIFDVTCKYGDAGVIAMAFRGTPTTHRYGLQTQNVSLITAAMLCSAVSSTDEC